MNRMTRHLAGILAFAVTYAALPALPAKAADGEQKAELLAAYTFEEADATDKVIADASGHGHDAALEGTGGAVQNGILTLPGGSAGSDAAYVSIPGEVFRGQDTLTVTLWLKNQTGTGNYAGMYFGTPSKHIGGGSSEMPLHYWLLNPEQPEGYFKSVWTDGDNASAPYSTETAVSTTKTGSDWAMYTTVITPGQITGYYNGQEVCGSRKSKTTTDFGTDLVSYIGRSPYNDKFYKGGVFGVKIYGRALSQQEIWKEYYGDVPTELNRDDLIRTGLAAAKNRLDLGDLSAVTNDLSLPEEISGASVSWSSSDSSVISADGKVHRNPASDKTATLTAALTIGSHTDSKTFPVTVRCGSAENLFDELTGRLYLDAIATEDFELPDCKDPAVSVKWTSSDPSVIAVSGEAGESKALVKRPESADATATLHVTAACGEGASRREIKKSFPLTVRGRDYGALAAYTNSNESSSLGNSLHYACSKDGKRYEALNSNTGICFAKNISNDKASNPNGLKDVHVFRKADGAYGLAARNVGTENYIFLFDSENLIDFTGERKLPVSSPVADILRVKAVSYGQDDIRYEILWTDGSKTYRAVTRDLKTVLEENPADGAAKNSEFSGDLPQGAEVGSLLPVSREEYERVAGKLGTVANTEILPVDIVVQEGSDASGLFLDRTVTAAYSDGSTKEMAVEWNAKDIAAIDSSVPGKYKVSGNIRQTKYKNPFIEQRADPCILRGNDGYYYFTASYPVCGKEEQQRGIGYDRIILRRAETIEGLADAAETAVWECKNSPSQFRFIWAPEIRLVKDTYYIFYTASTEQNSVWGIRPHVLKCTDPADIMNPTSWQELGRMQAVSTDSRSFSGFSLDMTVFENDGHWYVIWAQALTGSSLLIAEINPDNPTQCLSDGVLITQPEYAWERQSENVNEGPSVIKHDGTIYVAFSAAGTGPEYCVGLLSIREGNDMLDASAWKKQSYPVLGSSDVPGEYGPGHNSFTVDEEGNPIFVYHARSEECYKKQCAWANAGHPLYDPCRQARLKRVHWAKDGTPILNMSYDEELDPEKQTVTATVTVKSKVQPPKDVAVTSVRLDPGTLKLAPGERRTLRASIAPENATDKSLSWKSSDTSIVTTDQDGTVTAVKEGSATVTATARNGRSAACAVTVTASSPRPNVKKISVKPVKATLGKGEKLTLRANISPAAAEQTVTWKSDKPGVAKVTPSGGVTARNAGTAKITAAANGKKAVCKITVKAAPKKITLNAKKKTLKKKGTYQLKVKLPKNTASYKITYTSSKKKVAAVSASGKITAKKKGKATITARTFNGKKASIQITVK